MSRVSPYLGGGQPSKKFVERLAKNGVTLNLFLGSGTFSDVFSGYVQDGHNKKHEVAVKCYKSEHQINHTQLQVVARREFEICKDLNHVNITKVLQFVDTATSLFMCQELARGGELYNAILTNSVDKPQVSGKILDGVLSGLVYLHEKVNFAHLDLKSENVLLHDNHIAKIADMDAAMPLFCETDLIRGTRDIQPPELSTPYPEFKTVSPAIDVWSVGMLAYLMISKQHAWDLPTDADPKFRSFQGKPIRNVEQGVWSKLPPNLANVFESVLAINPGGRPSAAALRDLFAVCWVPDVSHMQAQHQHNHNHNHQQQWRPPVNPFKASSPSRPTASTTHVKKKPAQAKKPSSFRKAFRAILR